MNSQNIWINWFFRKQVADICSVTDGPKGLIRVIMATPSGLHVFSE